MATTNFDTGTVVTKEWLNDVDAFVYEGVTPGTTSLNIDTINEKTTDAGVTVEGVLLKDNTIDINGTADAFILDTDGDTTISAPTDDQIDIEISGADDFRFTANKLTALSGSVIETDTINETTAASGVTIDGVLLKDGVVSSTVPTGFRNLVINGSMEINQRATIGSTLTPTDGQMLGVDRWRCIHNATSAQWATLSSLGSIPIDAKNALRFVHQDVGVLKYIGAVQIIESNLVEYAKGKAVTLSAQAESSNGGTIYYAILELSTATDTYVDPVSVWSTTPTWAPSFTQVAFGSTVLSLNTWTSITPITGTVGTTLGTNLYVLFFSAETGTNKYTQITNVQLEIGSVSTPFEKRPFGVELSLCQRYYEKSFNLSITPASNIGTTTGETRWRAILSGAVALGSPTIPFKVSKRVAPTITLYNPAATGGEVRDISGSLNASSTSVGDVEENGFIISSIANAGTSANNAVGIHWTADAEL